MWSHQLTWLSSVLFAFSSGVATIFIGSRLLRRTVDDLSNSTAWQAYALRVFRLIPGLALTAFGCWIVWTMVLYIESSPLPSLAAPVL